MKDSIQLTEGGNYSNAGLSISRRGPALRNVTSHCGERQNGRPSETDLILKGIKNEEWVDLYYYRVVVFTVN